MNCCGVGRGRAGRVRIVAAAVVGALSLGACAIQPPTQTPAPTPVETPSQAPSPAYTPTSTGTAVALPPMVQTPQAALLLGPSSLGTFAFGTAEADVVAGLKQRFGQPDQTDEGVSCDINPESTYGASYVYGGLSVLFAAKDRKASSPRKLSGWVYALANGMDPAFALVDDLPADPTFAQLATLYPKGKLDDGDFSDLFGTKVFTLPDGIWFVGATEPEAVGAGPLLACE